MNTESRLTCCDGASCYGWSRWSRSWNGRNMYTHYSDVIMSVIGPQITGVSIVYSTSVQAQLEENIKALRHWPLWGEFPHKGPVTRKMFPFDDVIMYTYHLRFWCRFYFRKYKQAWYFQLFPNTEVLHVVKTLNVRGPSYLGLTRSIPWLLMPWLLTSPGHQQPWYWLYRICRTWSYLGKDFKYLCNINVE